MKVKEAQKQLNQYTKEITADLTGKPDEETGFYSTHLILGEFLCNRGQPTILCSFIDMSGCVAIDSHEKLSKKLVIKRMINSVQDMIDLLEKSKKKLEVITEESVLEEK